MLGMHYVIGSNMISYLPDKGIVSALQRISVQDSKSVFGDIGATHADLM